MKQKLKGKKKLYFSKNFYLHFFFRFFSFGFLQKEKNRKNNQKKSNKNRVLFFNREIFFKYIKMFRWNSKSPRKFVFFGLKPIVYRYFDFNRKIFFNNINNRYKKFLFQKKKIFYYSSYYFFKKYEKKVEMKFIDVMDKDYSVFFNFVRHSFLLKNKFKFFVFPKKSFLGNIYVQNFFFEKKRKFLNFYQNFVRKKFSIIFF